MDAVTQQNAATAEETASASEELAAQSQTLLDLIGTLASQVKDTHKDKLQDGSDNATGYLEIEQTEKKDSSTSYQENNGKNGNKGASQQIDEEKLIPMDDNRIKEHSEHFGDF